MTRKILYSMICIKKILLCPTSVGVFQSCGCHKRNQLILEPLLPTKDLVNTLQSNWHFSMQAPKWTQGVVNDRSTIHVLSQEKNQIRKQKTKTTKKN